jgi:hypothetical protein
LRRVIEEDEIQPCQLLRDGLVLYGAKYDWRETLVERGGKRNLFQGNGVRLYRIGTEHEHDSVRTGNQVLYALPPLLEGIDVGAVNQRLEAACPERCVEAISEGYVFAGVGGSAGADVRFGSCVTSIAGPNGDA